VAFIDKSFSDNVANPFDDLVMWVTAKEILAALSSSGVRTPQGAMNDKLQAIRDALLAYIAADNADPDGALPRTVARRLPCADIDSNGTADCPNTAGTVPWSELGIPVTTATDPWARPIRYILFEPLGNPSPLLKSSTGSNVGIQTTFPPATWTVTLTSDGPDGVAGNADDVSLTMTASELRGALIASHVVLD
jgi:hypothetical protein